VKKVERSKLATAERLKAGALASAYAAYKRFHGVGGGIGRAEEWLHRHSADPHWNESYYFNFTSPGEKTGGWTRIGITPNQEKDVGAMMLFAGGSRILVSRPEEKVEIGGGRLETGPLAYDCLEPGSRWRLSFSGEMGDIEDSRTLPDLDPGSIPRIDVEVDLTFEGIAPCFDFKDADPAALAEMIVRAGTRLSDIRKVTRVSAEHYEQVGKVTGAIRHSGGETNFVGSGHRDHSWGPRDWAAPRLWTWLTCQFDGEPAFNLSRVVIESVDVFNGFVTRGGANYPVRRVDLETEFEPDGVTQKAVRFTLEDTSGVSMEVTGRPLTVVPLLLESDGHRTLVNEAMTAYRMGERTGYGISEYLHQLGPEGH
jgi:hypothetical protein